MNKLSLSLLVSVVISIFLIGCQDVKKGFSGKKIDQGNEFLVIKKNPLVVPPDFDELPQPQNENSLENDPNKNIQEYNEFKDLLMKNEDKVNKNETITDSNLEENILKQINK